MPTRLYLKSTGSPAVTPSSWLFTNQINPVTLPAGTTRGETAYSTKTEATGTTNPTMRAMARFIYGPLAAQTISGTIKGQMLSTESNAAANATLAIGIKIIKLDGTDRATLLSPTASDSATSPYEIETTLNNRKFYNSNESASIALTSQVASEGDYLVVEIGFRSATGTSRNISIRYGDNSGSNDLPESSGETTDYNPWVEFSGTVALAGMLVDDFNDNSRDSNKWDLGIYDAAKTDLNVTTLEQNSRVEITPLTSTTGHHYNGYLSKGRYDFTDRWVVVEVPQVTGGDCPTELVLDVDIDNNLLIDVEGGQLYMRRRVGAVNSTTNIAYSASTHRWWRIRHVSSDDTIRFETSADGIAWTERRSVARGGLTITALRYGFLAGSYDSQPSPGVAYVDNFSALIGDVSGTTVTPDAVTVAATAIDPTVILGAIIITPDAVTVAATAIDPTVVLGAITPDAVTVAATAIDPTVILGAITITPDVVTVAATAIDPTVTLGAITITPAFVTVAVTAIDPTVEIGGGPITPAFVTVAVTAINPVVIGGEPPPVLGQADTPGLIIFLLASAVYHELSAAGLGAGLEEPDDGNAAWWSDYLFG